jgi:adenylate kinase
MKKTKIVNFFGGPGSGKSTITSGVFYELKRMGLECDNPYEFPKQVAWEENNSQISDQLYIFANQHRGIVRSYGKVDFIILDSPILLSLAYKDGYNKEYPASIYGKGFDDMVIETFSKYHNINFFLRRNEEDFQQTGRFQSYEESLEFDEKIKYHLDANGFPYYCLDINDKTVDTVVSFLRQYNRGL